MTGPAHAEDGSEGQDAFAIKTGPGDYIVAVVCDGAGSTRHGGTAARITCEALPSLLFQRLLPGLDDDTIPRQLARARGNLRAALSEARSMLLDRAAELQAHPDELLSTLVGVVAHPVLGGMFFHIGDGAALCFDGNGSMLAISPPENGEYLNTTYFFIEEEWRRHLRVRFFGGGYKSIVLMTDGATDLALKRQPGRAVAPFEPFFTPVLHFLAGAAPSDGELGLREILDGEAARAKVDDDKTFVWLEAKTGNA